MVKADSSVDELKPDTALMVHEKALNLLNGVNIKGKRVVDLGSGQGAFAKALADKGASYVICIDLDPRVFKLKYSSKVDFIVTDLDHGLPLRSNSFDLAVAIEVIEHLFNVKLFVKEVYRVLKSGGIFIVTTPNVEHILSRIYFFFTGRLWHFFKGSEWKHVTPMFSWKFRQLIRGLFVIEKVNFNRVVPWPKIPLLRGKPLIPFLEEPGKLLGEIWLLKLRVIKKSSVDLSGKL